MSDTVQIGAGTTFSYSADGTTYTALAKIEGLTPATLEVTDVAIDTFDAPLLNSTVPQSLFIPGWGNGGGEWGAKLKFLKTQFAALRALVGVPAFYKVIKRDGSGYAFPGYIKKLGEEVPLKEAMTCDVTVKVTGGAAPFSAAQS